MKKSSGKTISVLLSALILVVGVLIASSSPVDNQPYPHEAPSEIVADFNRRALVNNLGGECGTWKRDPSDERQYVSASLNNKIRRGIYGSALKLEYNVGSPNDAANGFWTRLLDLNASPYDHFEFWVKGDADKGFTSLFKIEFKKTQKDREGCDETVKGSYVVKGVTDKWQKISIPLNVMSGILDWRDLKELVISFEKKRVDNPKGVLYFDDFTFVKTWKPGPKITDIVPHKVRKTDKQNDPKEFAEFLIARLYGFPERVFVRKAFPKDDREFLIAIAKDIWKYFNDIVDREHGLPLDNIRFCAETTFSKDTRIGDYTNITNIGLYLMCVVSAYDFAFISKEKAVKSLATALDSMERLEKHNGFPYNYYDVTIFQRTSNFISFVDSGWYAAGIIVAKNAFPEELGERCQKLLDQMNFSFFYDPVEGHMYHGFYTNINYYSEYRYGVFYTEARAASYIAIGKGDVPREHWFQLARTFPETWPWQTQIPIDRRQKRYLGCSVWGGYYEYEGMRFVPSWGGSMFEALMPTLIIDEKGLAPSGLGLNDEQHAKIQVKYALEELGYSIFGMSPCCVLGGRYSEFGVKALGVKGYKAGFITPHASFLSLEFIPEKAIGNLRTMLAKYDVYGEYGFYDAIDISSGKAVIEYLCLDQAMSFIALNNYINNGAIRKRFHNDPIAKNAEAIIKVEDFFE